MAKMIKRGTKPPKEKKEILEAPAKRPTKPRASKLESDTTETDAELTAELIAFAKLKRKMRKIEEEIQERQKALLLKIDKTKKYTTEFGKLFFGKRDTWVCKDKTAVIKKMGIATYKQHSSITKTGVEGGIGSKGFEELVESGAFEITKTSEYITLK